MLANRLVVSAALAVLAASASAQPLMVRMSAPVLVVRGDVNVMVDVDITNPSREAVSVLRWELPANATESPYFAITREGQAVQYTGRLIKRAAPTKADYVRIEPGATLSYSVELTAAYDLSKSGTYSITYRGLMAGTSVRTDAMYLWLEGRSGRSPQASRASLLQPTVPPGTDAITYTGNCSSTQQTQLAQAVADGLTYSNNAVAYFSTTPAATQRFTKWFGPGARSSFGTVRKNFLAIQDAFATKPLTLDCSCTQAGVYAYVFANQPYKIYACPVFWTAPAVGTDSKAGTLVHEMSHFTVVAGTQDYAYGQTAAAALAINNPSQAIANADSHEYFAENTPTLP